jgi:hypothetical protein
LLLHNRIGQAANGAIRLGEAPQRAMQNLFLIEPTNCPYEYQDKLQTFADYFIVSTMSLTASAQQNSWSANNESRSNIATDKAVARLSFPKEFKLFNLNIEPLRQQLFSIVGSNALQRSTVVVLPNADGEYEQFEVFEASNFEPDLQARFSEIRAYSGKGITDKYATLKLSISPQGIQTMVFRTDKENEFIEPYSHDHTVYAVYKSQREKREATLDLFYGG